MDKISQLISTNLDFVAKGGPLMYALLLCSVIALAMIIERLLVLRKGSVIRLDLLREIEISLEAGDFKEALDVSSRSDAPMMKIAKIALIHYNKPKAEIQRALEDAGRREVPVLERFLTPLNTIAVISPLLGLLGTVTGMIDVFQTILSLGVGNANNLAGGISEALITTATGMTVAIPVLVFYNFFSGKVDHLLLEMERYSLTLLDLIIRKRDE